MCITLDRLGGRIDRLLGVLVVDGHNGRIDRLLLLVVDRLRLLLLLSCYRFEFRSVCVTGVGVGDPERPLVEDIDLVLRVLKFSLFDWLFHNVCLTAS